jgi:glutamine synthetase
MDGEEQARRARRARELVATLEAEDVEVVALTWVDNAGITRVKTVPLSRLEQAAAWGVGMSPVFDVFLLNDSITTSEFIGGPDGDLRLIPDLSRITRLAAQPGWAWAPVDRYTQEGQVYMACQRWFARRMMVLARQRGFDLRMGFEIEWFVGYEVDGAVVPAASGPAYGMTRVVELAGYVREILATLAAQGIEVLQFHPEYSAGQLELSFAAEDPLAAADLSVLVRQTIRTVSLRHGYQTSFAPVVVAGQVGNGGHLHASIWQSGRNLCSGGSGPYGMTAAAESFVAGVLRQLPALLAVGAPSVSSYLRLVPSRWAGVFQCWGRENREAAVRVITGMTGSEGVNANVEIKCFDLSANPYLAAGCVIAAGLEGIDDGLRLPAEVVGDPAGMVAEDLEKLGVKRLPETLAEAADEMEHCETIRDAMGPPLFEAFLAVRRAEVELFAGQTADQIVAATRWRH